VAGAKHHETRTQDEQNDQEYCVTAREPARSGRVVHLRHEWNLAGL